MSLQIIRDDITRVRCDAIVNAAKKSLLGGGGVDGAIHRAAGPRLLIECMTLGGCKTGQAKITGGYALPAKYVIHTVGPVWQGGSCGEQEQLASCYRQSLQLAVKHNCQSVAFPLISTGAFGFPKHQALRIAVNTITDFLLELDTDLTVYLVIFNKSAYLISQKLYADIKSFIDDVYVDEHDDSPQRRFERFQAAQMEDEAPLFDAEDVCYTRPPLDNSEKTARRKMRRESPKSPSVAPEYSVPSENIDLQKMRRESLACPPVAPKCHMAPQRRSAPSEETEPQKMCGIFSDFATRDLDPSGTRMTNLTNLLRQMDESFTQMLLRKIDERGIKDSECYKRANIDRKLFSKIRSDVHYKPSKQTVIALAIALELPLNETKDMLMKAGYALSHSNQFDIIVEYFIRRGNYDIFEINEALFAFDQRLLGS